MKSHGQPRIALFALPLLILPAVVFWLCARQAPPEERLLAAFATDLSERSAGQVANALQAARALDGAVIAPGQEFSFNQRVGPWTIDRGYRRAPVSYDGELTLAAGGGVCQTSSALYGAALLAGMEIIERHRHFWPANYARPGLDAAVAHPSIDLRFRNPLSENVRLNAHRRGRQLIVELRSTAPSSAYSIEVERLAIHPPSTIIWPDSRLDPGRTLRANRGQPGWDVAVYRVSYSPQREPQRTLISLDSYPTLNTILKVGPSQSDDKL